LGSLPGQRTSRGITHHISVRMFDALLWVALTVLILGLTLYVLLENSNKEDRRQRKRLRSGAAS
jgi:hypothetical protein